MISEGNVVLVSRVGALVQANGFGLDRAKGSSLA
jgi:hypothetical protein